MIPRALVLVGVLILGNGVAWAEPDKKPSKRAARKLEKALEKASKKTGVPADALAKVGGHRILSSRAEDLRSLCVDLHAKVDARNLPLVLKLATSPKLDPEVRYAAVALISTYALEGDEDGYLALGKPLKRLYADEFQKVWELAADENRRLLRWFELDQEVSELFVKTYRGKHYRKAQRAYRAVLELRHPELREGVAQDAIREALDPRSRFGIKERQLAVREAGRRGKPLKAAQLAEMLHADGTIAVACAEALADLDDARVLPSLRTIGRTSAHVLRVPVLRTRGVLQDASLVDLVGPTFADDHVVIRAALVVAIGELRHERVKDVLDKLAPRVQDPSVKKALALVRLRHGEESVAGELSESLAGEEADRRLGGEILATRAKAADSLVLLIAKGSAKPLEGLKPRAVAEIGRRRLFDPSTIGWVGSLCTGDEKTPLRLHAAATLVQAGAPQARKALQAALKDFKVVKRVDVKTALGKARRYDGSHLGDVCERWARDQTWAALPILARWLDPPEKKPKAGAPKESSEDEGGTKTRGQKGARRRRPPAKLAPYLRHAFVRRSVVEALGELLWAAEEVKAGRGKEGWPEPPKALDRFRALAEGALARSLDDPQALVQRAAVRALARLGGHRLEPGASLVDAAKARAAAEAYLKR